jgi:hypothetical protein
MDVFDKFFKKFAYKFPKGYPDMNNEQDILLLENILGKLGIDINEAESPNSLQAKNILKKEFDLNDDNFMDISSTSFKVLVDGSERNDFIKKASNLDDFEHELKGSSSIGRLVYQPENFKKPILITVKPKSAQGLGSAGKLNEFSFNNIINSAITQNEGPITVVLKSSKKTITVPNVAKAQDSSASGTDEFSKSDSQLLDPSLKTVLLNVSLKKRNAIRWESSKTRPVGGINIFKSFIEKVGKIGTDNEKGAFDNVVLYPLDRSGKYKLYDPKNNKILSKVIITNVPDEVEDKVIFGVDEPKTVIIKETFEGGYNDYTFENGVLTLNCYLIYTDFEDIKGTQDEPVFAFSNHIGQSYGIEFRSFSKGALYSDSDDLKGSSTEINFNDLK